MGDQLPEQILMDILLRVPAKTVGRCRCVSKPWRTILSTPYFIRSYLLSENINLLLLTCNSNSNTIPLSHTINKNDDAVSATTTNTLRLPAGDNWRTRIFGSCAGLVQVMILGGCLCVLDVDPGYVGTDVWIMKEYGFVESWTKLCAIDISGYDSYGIRRLLCLVGDDEIAFLTTEGTLVSYSMKDGSLRDMMINVDGVFKDGVAFVPILASLAPSSSQ